MGHGKRVGKCERIVILGCEAERAGYNALGMVGRLGLVEKRGQGWFDGNRKWGRNHLCGANEIMYLNLRLGGIKVGLDLEKMVGIKLVGFV